VLINLADYNAAIYDLSLAIANNHDKLS